MLRIVLNFLISILVMLGLNYIGWVHLDPSIKAPTLEDTLIVAAIIVVIFAILKNIADFLFTLFTIASCGLGCLLYPIYSIVIGLVVLYVVAALAPNYLSVTSNLLLGILAGLVLGIVQIPAPQKRTDSADN